MRGKWEPSMTRSCGGGARMGVGGAAAALHYAKGYRHRKAA